MTIIFKGHVERLERGGPLHSKVTVRGEIERISESLTINLSAVEAAYYQPGTPVQIQIHPTGKP
jgi:hypothetical protein